MDITKQTLADLPPEVIDAMDRQVKAMGMNFHPEGLFDREVSGPSGLPFSTVATMLSPEETASLLLQKLAVAEIERGLPNCTKEIGDDATLVSMPLDDLRFAFGYLALMEARTPITSDQTARASRLGVMLNATRPDVARHSPARRGKARQGKARKEGR